MGQHTHLLDRNARLLGNRRADQVHRHASSGIAHRAMHHIHQRG
jgi:hypothetical protein